MTKMFGVLMMDHIVNLPKKGPLKLKTGSIVRIIGKAEVFNQPDMLYYLVQTESGTAPFVIPANVKESTILVINEKEHFGGVSDERH